MTVEMGQAFVGWGRSICCLPAQQHSLKSFFFAHGADLCRGASRHHGERRLAQAARVEDAYGGHGVVVEQNGRHRFVVCLHNNTRSNLFLVVRSAARSATCRPLLGAARLVTLSGRAYPMDGPPAALDFTPNVADGVADAAENAACAEPAPNLSPARATRGAGAVGYAARLQRTGTVL